MSHTNPRAQFDYQSWFNRHVAQRTKAALEARDAAFAEKHADTPLPELARYLARWGQTLRHSPSPCEVDGGDFIAQRFGSWNAALRAAKLPPAAEKKLKDTARYQKERKIQEPLFNEESERRRKEKRARAAQRHAQQQAQLHEKKQAEQAEALDKAAPMCEARHCFKTKAPETAE